MDGLLKLVIADDHPLIRDGIKANVAAEHDMLCIGEAEDGDSLLALLERGVPDVLLLDLNMPGLWAAPIEYIRTLQHRHPAMRILVLTAHDELDLVISVLRAGASGYMLKQAVSRRIVEAIRQLMQGETWLSPQIATAVLQRAMGILQHQQEVALTARERQVVLLIAQDRTVGQIAIELGIAESTVLTHLRRAYQRIGVHSRVGVVHYVLHHLLPGGEALRTKVLH